MPERGHHVGLKVIPLEEVLLLVGHRGGAGSVGGRVKYDVVRCGRFQQAGLSSLRQ